MTSKTQPAEKSLKRMRTYVEKYRQKSGTSAHPNQEVTHAVVLGLTHHATPGKGREARHKGESIERTV